MFDFINIGISDILDIVAVAVLLYQIYKLIRGTSAMNIFTGILLLYFLWYVARALHMDLSSAILGQILGVGILALIIVFQQEIRRFLLHIGTRFNTQRYAWLQKIFSQHAQLAIKLDVDELVMACKHMADTKTGALIAIERTSSLSMYASTGDIIDARLCNRLLENIFFKNSPLHDGAVVITGNKIHAARCTLPITERFVPAQYGMRHRASVGLTEITDSVVIAISEETGYISLIVNGIINKINSVNELRLKIEENLK